MGLLCGDSGGRLNGGAVAQVHRKHSEVEVFSHEGRDLVYVISHSLLPTQTEFYSKADDEFQCGHIVRVAGESVPRHVHLGGHRVIRTTPEVLVVRKGTCLMDIYSPDQKLLATRELTQGDTVVILSGGHGFRMLEDTVLFEVKQGPYLGDGEKVRF